MAVNSDVGVDMAIGCCHLRKPPSEKDFALLNVVTNVRCDYNFDISVGRRLLFFQTDPYLHPQSSSRCVTLDSVAFILFQDVFMYSLLSHPLFCMS